MKKFLTYVSMQYGNNLSKILYIPVDMDSVVIDNPVSFPISVLIENFLEEDEEAEILCMMERDNEDVKKNYEVLKNEIEALGKNFSKIKWTVIDAEPEENIDSQLLLFERLISHINDEDRMYVCETFGTKPIPIVEMMALNFAYRTCKNVTIEKIVYGKINRSAGEVKSGYLYDVTATFFMNQIVNHLSLDGATDPKTVIRRLLGLEE